jgi:hypothetical protein
MAYNAFTLNEVKRQFGLQIHEQEALFADAPSVEVSPWLQETLREFAPLALAMSTEKARSEMIIAPILLEVRRQKHETISLFSGMEFTVDATQGLVGFCDYLLSLSPTHFTIEAPVVAVVEAKNENLRGGMGQCIAEMVAAKLFNEQQGKPLKNIYGAITTGSNWRFLRLQSTNVHIDLTERYLDQPGAIVGVLLWMMEHTGSE